MGVHGTLFGLLFLLTACSPSGPKALLEGEKLFRAGSYSEAVDRFQVASELLPANAHAWNYLGLGYHALNKPNEARQAYMQAMTRDRNLAIVRFNLGCLLLETGDFSGAVNELTTYTVLQPQSEPGFVKLAAAQIKNRSLDPAEGSLRKALQLNPKNAESLNNFGWVLMQKRRSREAYNQFLAAIQVDPKYAPALLNLAIVSHQMNNRPLAIKALRDYLQTRLEPGMPTPDVIRAWIAQLEFELQPPKANLIPSVAVPPARGNPVESSNRLVSAIPPAPIVPSVPSPTTASTPSVPARAIATNPTVAVRNGSALPPSTSKPAGPASLASVNPAPISTKASPSIATPALLQTQTSSPSPKTNVVDAKKPPEPPTVSPRTEPTKTVLATALADPPPSTVPKESTPVPLPPAVLPPAVSSARPSPTSEVTNPTPLVSSPPPANAVPVVVPSSRRIESIETADAKVGDKGGFWQRFNPGKWFQTTEKRATPLTEQPALVSPPAPLPKRTSVTSLSSSVLSNAVQRSPSSSVKPAAAAITQPNFPRYVSQLPAKLTPGDREKSAIELAMGMQAHQQSRLPEALGAYKRAVTADPTYYEAQYHLGVAAMDSGDTQGALAAYEAAVSLKPDATPSRYNFALALRKAGMPHDAADQAKAMIQTNPAEIRAHLLLANLATSELGSAAQAREHYVKVLMLDPRHPQASVIRSWLATHP